MRRGAKTASSARTADSRACVQKEVVAICARRRAWDQTKTAEGNCGSMAKFEINMKSGVTLKIRFHFDWTLSNLA